MPRLRPENGTTFGQIGPRVPTGLIFKDFHFSANFCGLFVRAVFSCYSTYNVVYYYLCYLTTKSNNKIKSPCLTPVLFSSQEYAMNFYASKGFPKEKLNAGLPFYGQSFSLSGASTEVGAPSSGPGAPGRFTQQNGMMAYYEICSASMFPDKY